MESWRPSEPWRPGDELEAVRLEQTRHLAEAAQLYAASANVHLHRGVQGGTAIAVDETPVPQHRIRRARVTVDQATLNDQGLLKAKLVDANLEVVEPEYFVRPSTPGLTVDDDLYIFLPTPNTIDFEDADVNGNPVWQELLALTQMQFTPETIGNSDETETADTTAVEEANKKSVSYTKLTRMAYNHAGDKKLYGYYRTETYEAGLLIAISQETRVEIDAAEACGGEEP